MKLKYYLRGLGIGMIVTALILGISFSNRQDQTSQIMTDDQIRERAAELGMVDSSESVSYTHLTLPTNREV